MESHIQTGTLLLLIAAVVAMLTRRLRLPYSVGLVAAGILLAMLPFAPKLASPRTSSSLHCFLRCFLKPRSTSIGISCAGTFQ